MQQIEDNFEDDEAYEEAPSFRESLYNNIASPIKQFLINYLGDALNNAPAQTFRDIEQVIKDDILLHAVMIPDYLYRYRTITDSDKWDEALDNFKRDDKTVFLWPQEEQWYNSRDNEDNDNDEDADNDLPAEAKNVIDAANDFLDDHQKFKTFMQQCCAVIIKETQLYLEKTAVFDLTILSADGYIAVQNAINMLAETLAEDLHAVTEKL
jgi:hypothetical protein